MVFAIVTIYLFNKHVMWIPHNIICYDWTVVKNNYSAVLTNKIVQVTILWQQHVLLNNKTVEVTFTL